MQEISTGIRRRDFLVNATLVSLSGVLGSCSRNGGRQTATDATPLQFLLPLPPTSLTFAPELLADAGGFFNANGLAVNLDVARNSAQAIQLILAGQSVLTRTTTIEGMLIAANQNAPMMNVGMLIKGSAIRFVSSKAAPLKSPSDFVGKTIGIPSKSGPSEHELDLFLRSSGIDPSTVRREVVGITPGAFTLIEQGLIAAYAVSIDTAELVLQQAEVEVLDPTGFSAASGQFYLTSRAGLERYAEEIGKFLRAIRQALVFMIDDHDFAMTLDMLRRKYSFPALEDDAVAKRCLREYLAIWAPTGPSELLMTAPDRWRDGYLELANAGLVSPSAAPGDWFTNSLAEKASA
ncbi:MAG: ABC transporter substrate-binding protein [Pseudomonadales bacterium]|jgi:NitT/TauT family transport system substrate-binding protein|nr:ABC transporter substrate-binding protein [Pseudomonadales bacterium]